MFVLGSDITIGTFRFNGVHSVRITRSLHSIVDTATITLPSVAVVMKKDDATPHREITGKQFMDGDPVTIKLGYNGDLQTEFTGFVKRRNLNMPLEVECEGYSWLLRRNTVKGIPKSVALKDLLKLAVSGIDKPYTINVVCDADIKLSNIVMDKPNGFDLINSIASYTEGCLSCFFIKPDTLWCGLIYTPYADGKDTLNQGEARYRLGYNLVKDNGLKERVTSDDPVQVKFSKKLSDGNKISGVSDAFKVFSRTHSKVLNQILEAPALKMLAKEKAYRINYAGYEGHLNAFLQPYAAPGYRAYVVDNSYPERNATFVVEGTEVTFGMNGARRIVEIGPRIGFANEKEK